MPRLPFVLTMGALFLAILTVGRQGPARSAVAKSPAASASTDLLLVLREQADLTDAAGIDDWFARGRWVVSRLRETAARSQAPLLARLEDGLASGAVHSFRSYYVVNAIAVRGDRDWLAGLAGDPVVVAAVPLAAVSAVGGPVTAPATAEWGVAQIGADEVWTDFGLRGDGVVVASVGTGVDASHPALAAQYRGTETGSHDYNWFDPTGAFPNAPGDDNGHGSHTTGTIVGDDAGVNQIGVAPGARWIAVKACNAFGACSQADLLAAAEWVLAPYPIGGGPGQGDPDQRPHLVNITWGGAGGDPWFQAATQSWRAAGIVPIAAAGGGGPAPGTIGSPADYPEVIAAGATDALDFVASFSARGPSALTPEIKPDVVAPGVGIRSANSEGGYSIFSGTSMAGAHLAGCAALVRAAAPALGPQEVEDVLEATALDVDAPGPDFNAGHGRIDCYAAVQAVGEFVRVPWIGLWGQHNGAVGLARGVVVVVDDAGNRVDAAMVSVTWTLPGGAVVSQTRQTVNGLAWFQRLFIQPGLVTLAVDDIDIEGMLLDRPASVLSRSEPIGP